MEELIVSEGREGERIGKGDEEGEVFVREGKKEGREEERG